MQKARAEGDLARVQDALVVAEEAKRKAKVKTARLEVERASLLLKDQNIGKHGYIGYIDKNIINSIKIIYIYIYILNFNI